MTSINRALLFFFLGALKISTADASCFKGVDTAIPESTPTTSFTVLGDGTVTDRKRGLMWMRCLVGQILSNNVCTGTSSILNWQDAIASANTMNFANHSDWRLPNPKELLSTIEDRCYSPSLNYDLFPITFIFSVWTSTPSGYSNGAYSYPWNVASDGTVNTGWGLLSETSVLLVRDAP